MIKVRDLMRTEVVTVREDMTVRELAAFLADEGISGAPVTSSSGEVVGVVSAKDILTAAAEGVPFMMTKSTSWTRNGLTRCPTSTPKLLRSRWIGILYGRHLRAWTNEPSARS